MFLNPLKAIKQINIINFKITYFHDAPHFVILFTKNNHKSTTHHVYNNSKKIKCFEQKYSDWKLFKIWWYFTDIDIWQIKHGTNFGDVLNVS